MIGGNRRTHSVKTRPFTLWKGPLDGLTLDVPIGMPYLDVVRSDRAYRYVLNHTTGRFEYQDA